MTAFDAARLLSLGDLTAERLVQSCIARIAQRNPEVRALVAFDADKALRFAREKDGEPYRPHLHGIPFVAKDIFETADYPTEFGSPIYAGHQPAADSACVSELRAQGAVLIGKAATSEFATRKPAATRNPLRPTHTPGGSSSGSAAAVADFMVPFALGTQTTGSIARPASYCGIVGFKPTFDLFNRTGLKATSHSQDTIGLLTRTVRDAFFITFNDTGFDAEVERAGTPRFAWCRSAQWQELDPAFHAAAERLERAFARAGQSLPSMHLSTGQESLIAVQEQIFVYEAALALAHERRHHGELISPVLQERLAKAADIDRDSYLRLRTEAARARCGVELLFQDADVLLYPATEGSAEEGLAYSGSPRFAALWTLLHLPTIVVPFGTTPNGMPFGIQLVGRFGQDRRLLAAAQRLCAHLEAPGEPSESARP